MVQSQDTLTASGVVAALVVAMSTFQFGYNLAELNEPREAMTCAEASDGDSKHLGFLKPCISMSAGQYALASSILAVGGFISALSAAQLAGNYGLGRKPLLLIASCIFIVGGIIKAIVNHVYLLYIGRFISGLGCGIAVVATPLLLNEIAPIGYKGSFGTMTQISINVGIIATQGSGLFLSEPMIWRWILCISALVAAVQFVCLPIFVTENKHEYEEIDNTDGVAESLLDDAHGHNKETVGLRTFIFDPQYRKGLLTVCGFLGAQQLTGINAVILHGVSILGTILPASAPVINVGISVANLLVTIFAGTIADKYSHKNLLMLSMSGMGFFAFGLAISVFFHVLWLAAVCCLFFVCSFSMGMGPLPFMVAVKVVPKRAEGAAQSMGLAVNWFFTGVVAAIVPILTTTIGMGPMFVGFGTLSILSALVTYKYVALY